jgi:hypothetical protein
MMNALFKIVVAIIVVLILLQLEYNGRKLQTYVVEYFKSLKGQKEVIYIQEDEQKPETGKKAVKGKAKAAAPEEKKIKIIRQKGNDQPDVSEKDRKELEQVFQ